MKPLDPGKICKGCLLELGISGLGRETQVYALLKLRGRELDDPGFRSFGVKSQAELERIVEEVEAELEKMVATCDHKDQGGGNGQS